MRLSTSGKFFAVAASAAATIAAPPFLGAAAAQSFYPPPGVGVEVYPPPPGAVDMYPTPREAMEAYPASPEPVDINRPPREAVEVSRQPRDEMGVPAQQIPGTTTPVSAVSMRAGPGTDNPVIGTLHPGMPLQLLATANHGWMQVQSPAGTGWVYGSYLASGTPGQAQASINAPTPPGVNASASMPSDGNNRPPSGASPPPGANNQPPPEITSP